MKLYKLTDEHERTFNNTRWGKNVTHQAVGNGRSLCSDGFIHAYTNPILAIIMNPIHAKFNNPILWEAEGKVIIDDGTKVGCKSLTTVRRIALPIVTIENKIRFAIKCASLVYDNKEWKNWADRWIKNIDRSYNIAVYAAAATYAANAANATYDAAADTATYAANAAATYAAADAAADTATYAANAAAAANKIKGSDLILQALNWAMSDSMEL